MNCPQCQTANGPGSAFCGNCGAQMTEAPATAPAGYPPPQGTTVPLGYGASSAPTEYGSPQGYNAAGGYKGPIDGTALDCSITVTDVSDLQTGETRRGTIPSIVLDAAIGHFRALVTAERLHFVA